MSQVSSRPRSLVTDCSTPALQPPKTRGRQRYSSTSRRHLQCRGRRCHQSGDSDERRSLMSDRYAGAVPCTAHNGTPEHTTGTGFALGCATSEAPVAVELCVLTFGASRQAECRHSERTAVGLAGIQRYRYRTHKNRITLIQVSDG